MAWSCHGFYIWENNYSRALEWAKDKKAKNGNDIFSPSVVGVIYQLEHCLDLSDSEFIGLLPQYYNLFKTTVEKIPMNKSSREDKHQDLVLRELDCAVIQFPHKEIDKQIEKETKEKGYSALKSFDTVRGIFTEGGAAFEGAGIQAKNHIQICIRNLDCIKGFFIPRDGI